MLRSPHRLARVVGLAVLAQHHLGLVLQGLHVLWILQAPRFWRRAAVRSKLISQPALPPSQSARALHLLPPKGRHLDTSGPVCGDGGKVKGRRKSLEFSFIIPKHFSGRKAETKIHLPGLKRTRAFMQANSVGSTANARNRETVSCRIRISALASASRPWELPAAEASGGASSGQLSRGRDHCMAPRRKSSLHASSSRITCAQKGSRGDGSYTEPLARTATSGSLLGSLGKERPVLGVQNILLTSA